MEKFRNKKTGATIEAAQWLQHKPIEGVFEVAALNGPLYSESMCSYCDMPFHSHGAMHTLEGFMIVHPGEWIMKEADGNMWPGDSAVFHSAFERVE